MQERIHDEIVRFDRLGILDQLLIDKTTKSNIIWATDDYREFGSAYERDREITSGLITDGTEIICIRAQKQKQAQSGRTKIRAEVFTPLQVCNDMNNYADEMYFGYPDVFNSDGLPTKSVIFPEDRIWQDYVRSTRLEITCGEAPFLVSRYDSSTGERIEIEKRIGMLDRKLRVVSENTNTEEEWIEWLIKAFQSTYGYEFCGDNLLIARLNLLLTFEEYLKDRLNREPDMNEYKKIINIITWNIWQMDGLTGTIPYSLVEEKNEQISLFDMLGVESKEEPKQPLCRIYDWRANRSIEFNEIGI